MKIIIELSDAEVKGIKAYLKECDDKFDKEAITAYIENIVSGNLHNPREAVSSYIND